jgi:hypothetical protein
MSLTTQRVMVFVAISLVIVIIVAVSRTVSDIHVAEKAFAACAEACAPYAPVPKGSIGLLDSCYCDLHYKAPDPGM